MLLYLSTNQSPNKQDTAILDFVIQNEGVGVNIQIIPYFRVNYSEYTVSKKKSMF